MSRHWLLVENLSGDVSGQHVVSLLSEFGSIKAFKYHKKRGMAIVEMSSQADAINASRRLHGASLWGHALKVTPLDRARSGRVSLYRLLFLL